MYLGYYFYIFLSYFEIGHNKNSITRICEPVGISDRFIKNNIKLQVLSVKGVAVNGVNKKRIAFLFIFVYDNKTTGKYI